MKKKRTFLETLAVFFGTLAVFVIGVVILAVIDGLLGIDLSNIGWMPWIIHSLIYMIWGIVIIKAFKWFKK